MKLLHISYHFEFGEEIDRILDRNGIRDFVRYPVAEGQDSSGRHEGSRVHPGHISVVQAQVREDGLEPLLADLKSFREAKQAHHHLEALVLPIERRL